MGGLFCEWEKNHLSKLAIMKEIGTAQTGNSSGHFREGKVKSCEERYFK
jgi:hypothetical protein